jgi:XTP/dITP diphosphohydrolase
MLDILIATTNPGKKSELIKMLGSLSAKINWLSLNDFPDTTEVTEDGSTFAENARKKALGYASQTGCITIADDSGIVIDALNGAPGVNSARFSGVKNPRDSRDLIDHRNILKVLELMKDISEEKRTARFVCNICLAQDQSIIAEKQGKFEGIITTKEIGSNGFGYDPIMYIPSFKKTVAQMTQDEKNKISHRSKAIQRMKPEIQKLVL